MGPTLHGLRGTLRLPTLRLAMDKPFQTHLDTAMAPLLQRTAKRVERLQRLAAGPQNEATAKAMAAEQREIELVQQLATRLGSIVTQMQRVITHNTRKCWELDLESQYWQQRFNQALVVGGKYVPVPANQPPLLRPLSEFFATSARTTQARHAAHVRNTRI